MILALLCAEQPDKRAVVDERPLSCPRPSIMLGGRDFPLRRRAFYIILERVLVSRLSHPSLRVSLDEFRMAGGFFILHRVSRMMTENKHIEASGAVHKRLRRFGNLGETFSDAIDRALDEVKTARDGGFRPRSHRDRWLPRGLAVLYRVPSPLVLNVVPLNITSPSPAVVNFASPNITLPLPRVVDSAL